MSLTPFIGDIFIVGSPPLSSKPFVDISKIARSVAVGFRAPTAEPPTSLIHTCKVIDYRMAFITFLSITIFRAIANVVRNNMLAPGQAETFPLRSPSG
jgi:hypothetical protein